MLTQDNQPSRSGIGEVSGAAPQGTPTNIDACYSSEAPRCITDAYASGALVPAVASGFLHLNGPAGALKNRMLTQDIQPSRSGIGEVSGAASRGAPTNSEAMPHDDGNTDCHLRHAGYQSVVHLRYDLFNGLCDE